ncbi:MAG: 30S ribosomal protein S6 [Ignavibacteriae bacterium]|jgi:small subunit ribosomal protein S6|nr:MAG: 30S ribosomal protein S6 [Ignavibacteriota bacterium]
MSIRRQYESTYIMNAALEDGEVETLIQRVSDFITENGGAIQELNKWGRRRLAYPIKKKYNGYYVYMVFESAAEIVPQLERFFTLDDGIMRQLTLQLDPKLREFRKVRAEAQALRAAQLAEEAANERSSN